MPEPVLHGLDVRSVADEERGLGVMMGAADNERKSTKIYCSKACQEAAKDLRTKARRKRQRAEAKKAKAVE